jgi:hypothetical protein
MEISALVKHRSSKAIRARIKNLDKDGDFETRFPWKTNRYEPAQNRKKEFQLSVGVRVGGSAINQVSMAVVSMQPKFKVCDMSNRKIVRIYGGLLHDKKANTAPEVETWFRRKVPLSFQEEFIKKYDKKKCIIPGSLLKLLWKKKSVSLPLFSFVIEI